DRDDSVAQACRADHDYRDLVLHHLVRARRRRGRVLVLTAPVDLDWVPGDPAEFGVGVVGCGHSRIAGRGLGDWGASLVVDQADLDRDTGGFLAGEIAREGGRDAAVTTPGGGRGRAAAAGVGSARTAATATCGRAGHCHSGQENKWCPAECPPGTAVV